jgi:hypothetical protein
VPRPVSHLLLSLAVIVLASAPAFAQGANDAEAYARARQAYERDAAAYWQAIGEKRKLRNAKRRDGQPIALDDYVLTQPPQPPVYPGPRRPIDPSAPPRPEPSRPYMPVVADFLAAAAEEFGFIPDRPSDSEFKRAYARAAAAAGLTQEQVVGVYIFETGGNGRYDTQAGVSRPGARAISPALGYNQLLSTNTVGLLAEHGDQYLALLTLKPSRARDPDPPSLDRKIEALRKMIAVARSVPFSWAEHDKLAKNTRQGWGIHAAVLDRDLGPLLQVRKLINSVQFARLKGHKAPLTAAELELMNFTGDGNGIDLVTMPHTLRARVPTANFFQREGYERNPIARRTGVVSALFASIEAKMEQADAPGARELAAAFAEAERDRGEIHLGR